MYLHSLILKLQVRTLKKIDNIDMKQKFTPERKLDTSFNGPTTSSPLMPIYSVEMLKCKNHEMVWSQVMTEPQLKSWEHRSVNLPQSHPGKSDTSHCSNWYELAKQSSTKSIHTLIEKHFSAVRGRVAEEFSCAKLLCVGRLKIFILEQNLEVCRILL